MKKKIVQALAVLSVLAVAQPSVARDFAEIYTQCGLGAMIAPKHEAVAAVTNVTWDLGTTAISSNATSPETCQGGKGKTAAFIHDAYPQLEKDLAKGEGAYLDTLLTLSGCASNVRPAVATALRKDFSTSVADPQYSRQSRYEQASGLYDMFYRRIEVGFADSCHTG